MECLSNKTKIENTFSTIRDFSFKEKKNPNIDEESINSFLDAILDFKEKLKEKTNKIHGIIELIESITWIGDLSKDGLMLLNDVISSAKDLQSSLIRQYILTEVFRRKGVAKEEIGDFKNSIDELKESYEDLESVFFFLPEMPEFVETNEKLGLM